MDSASTAVSCLKVAADAGLRSVAGPLIRPESSILADTHTPANPAGRAETQIDSRKPWRPLSPAHVSVWTGRFEGLLLKIYDSLNSRGVRRRLKLIEASGCPSQTGRQKSCWGGGSTVHQNPKNNPQVNINEKSSLGFQIGQIRFSDHN